MHTATVCKAGVAVHGYAHVLLHHGEAGVSMICVDCVDLRIITVGDGGVRIPVTCGLRVGEWRDKVA